MENKLYEFNPPALRCYALVMRSKGIATQSKAQQTIAYATQTIAYATQSIAWVASRGNATNTTSSNYNNTRLALVLASPTTAYQVRTKQ